MYYTKKGWKEVIESIQDWQSLNPTVIADRLNVSRDIIRAVMKENGMQCADGRKNPRRNKVVASEWTRKKEERRGLLKAKCDQLDRALAKATDKRCDKCALLKRQCWDCYSLEVAGRYPIDPCIHMIEPRGVYV